MQCSQCSVATISSLTMQQQHRELSQSVCVALWQCLWRPYIHDGRCKMCQTDYSWSWNDQIGHNDMTITGDTPPHTAPTHMDALVVAGLNTHLAPSQWWWRHSWLTAGMPFHAIWYGSRLMRDCGWVYITFIIAYIFILNCVEQIFIFLLIVITIVECSRYIHNIYLLYIGIYFVRYARYTKCIFTKYQLV